MKSKIYLLFVLILSSSFVFAQKDVIIKNPAESIKNNLIELEKSYSTVQKYYEDTSISVDTLKRKIGVNSGEKDFKLLKNKIDSIKLLSLDLNTLIDSALVYKKYYKYSIKNDELGIGDSLDYFFKKRDKINLVEKERMPNKSKTLFYFGKDNVIAEEDSILNNEKYNAVFKNILSSESKAYLGDFIIPQDGQKIEISGEEEIEVDMFEKETFLWIFKRGEKKLTVPITKEVFFKNMKIHVEHGLIQDIKIIVLDRDGNELLFENNIPISLLKYSKIASRNSMFYRSTMSNNKDEVVAEKKYKGFTLTLSDVLMYINNPGENFVPDDLKLEFPTKTDGKLDNISSSIKYKVEQNTALENVLNLRSYTDFSGLFGDSPNGIIQLEGKADFYIAPFNLTNSNIHFFKKISPFVNFARLDDDLRSISLENNRFSNNLEILEKSYLNMGIDLDVFCFKIKKESPFDMTAYATTRYNISDVMSADSSVVNYKSLALGGGIRVDIKRYSNFGLILKSELTSLNTNDFNTIESIENPTDFLVFRNEAEIFYHPSENINQALFLRLNTFNNSSAGNNEAFYQLQFGYRFSIGVSKLKN